MSSGKGYRSGSQAAAAPVKDWEQPQVETEEYPTMHTGTAFVGHHYMQCTVQRPFQPYVQLRFPLFVRAAEDQLLLQ